MNTKEKAQKIANFYQGLSDNDNGFTYEHLDSEINELQGPNIASSSTVLHLWKVNPPKLKKKIIDLSMMVNSNIDMEFSDEDQENWHLGGKLTGIVNEAYIDYHNDYFRSCRIRQNHWHSWNSEKCPIPDGLIIGYSMLNGNRRWVNNCSLYFDLLWQNIYEFKIIGVAEGYKYEWQNE